MIVLGDANQTSHLRRDNKGCSNIQLTSEPETVRKEQAAYVNSNWTIGYCTNVHAGTGGSQIRTNLQEISVPVRESLGRDTMGVGLWIPADAASEFSQAGAAEDFRDWLAERGLMPFTINGFPYGNFHEKVVKHRVYKPTWWESDRREYTLQLIDILDRILPSGAVGSISTLPLGWGTPEVSKDQMQAAVANLNLVAQRLHQLEEKSGRRICLAIEPEPGCVLDTTSDMLRFFEAHFPDESARRYLTVCHDICHAEVMYEQQAEVLNSYASAGVQIGKVQVSNAIAVHWQQMNEATREEAISQLSEFAEDKFLHQTSVQNADGQTCLVEDLPQLIENTTPAITDQSWRIHFHVPIYLEKFGHLDATRSSVLECLAGLSDQANLGFTGHLEAETYAWGALPEHLQTETLAEGIAAELRWLHKQVET